MLYSMHLAMLKLFILFRADCIDNTIDAGKESKILFFNAFATSGLIQKIINQLNNPLKNLSSFL